MAHEIDRGAEAPRDGYTTALFVPYAALQAFGGPIFYRYSDVAVIGTDLYKYQIAGGLSFALPSRVLDAFIEGVPLGESGMSAGLGTTF